MSKLTLFSTIFSPYEKLTFSRDILCSSEYESCLSAGFSSGSLSSSIIHSALAIIPKYLGNSEDIEYKLREAKKIIAEEDENDPNQIGEINLSILKKVYVEKLDTLEETTTAKKDVTTQPETTAPDSTVEPEEDETTTLPEEETEPDGEETTAEDIPEDE